MRSSSRRNRWCQALRARCWVKARSVPQSPSWANNRVIRRIGRVGHSWDRPASSWIGPCPRQASIGRVSTSRMPSNTSNSSNVENGAFTKNARRARSSAIGGGSTLVHPKVVVALGATAVLALAAKALPLARFRGPAEFQGLAGFITVHPSYLLRIPDLDARKQGYRQFVRDLQAIRKLVRARHAARSATALRS
jgi:hypothetical protein